MGWRYLISDDQLLEMMRLSYGLEKSTSGPLGKMLKSIQLQWVFRSRTELDEDVKTVKKALTMGMK